MALTPLALPDGSQVRRLRLRKGWTQEELGQQIRRTQAAISKLESGKPVSCRLMRQVARALQVEFGDIAEIVLRDEEDQQEAPSEPKVVAA